MTETKPEGRQKHHQQQQQHHQQQQNKLCRRRSDSICSSTVYSDLSPEEAQSLELLELVVRVIGQVRGPGRVGRIFVRSGEKVALWWSDLCGLVRGRRWSQHLSVVHVILSGEKY